MDMPARCASFRNCKECKFGADSITFKENNEYEMILNGPSWTGSCVSPWNLTDNYCQAQKRHRRSD
jgi:hypothetical protein